MVEPVSKEEQLILIKLQREEVIKSLAEVDRQIEYLLGQKEELRDALKRLNEEMSDLKSGGGAKRRGQQPAPKSRPNKSGRARIPSETQGAADGDNEAPADTPANCRCVLKIPNEDGSFINVFICEGDDVAEVINKVAKKHQLSEDVRDVVLTQALKSIQAAEPAPAASEAAPAPAPEKKSGRGRKQKQKKGKPAEQPKKEEPEEKKEEAEPKKEEAQEKKEEPKKAKKPRRKNPQKKVEKEGEEGSTAEEKREAGGKLRIVRPKVAQAGEDAVEPAKEESNAPPKDPSAEPKAESGTAEPKSEEKTPEPKAESETAEPKSEEKTEADVPAVDESKPATETAVSN